MTRTNPIAIAAACIASLTLIACNGHSHLTAAEDAGQEIQTGSFLHRGQAKPKLILLFRGERFEAEGFPVKRKNNLRQLQQQYGHGDHYNRIVSGLDTDHTQYFAEPELLSRNGLVLRCSLQWQADDRPAGKCETKDGEMVEVRFGSIEG